MTQSSPPASRLWFFRIAGLLVVVAIIAFGWNFLWNKGAGFIDAETTRLIARSNDAGREIDCANRRIEGFPFRIGIFCDSLALYASHHGIQVNAGAFRSAAQFYRPDRIIAELDGPLAASLPNAQSYAADWQSLRSSVSASLDGLRRLSVEAKGLDLSARDGTAGPLFSSEFDHAELHLRPAAEEGRDNSVDLAFLASNLHLQRPGMAPLAGLSFSGDLRLDGMRAELQPGFDLMRHLRRNGLSGEIRRAQVMPTDGGSVTLGGPFEIGRDGMITAELAISADNIGATSAFLARTFPEQADIWEQLGQAAIFLAALSGGGKADADFTIRIEHGTIYAGPLRIGEIAPLF